MRHLKQTVALVILIILVTLGAAIFCSVNAPDIWEATVATLTESPGRQGLAAAAIILLLVLALLPERKSTPFLSFDKEGGTVSISTTAIADYLSKLADEFPSITRMQPRVVPRKTMIDIVIRIRITAGPQIHEICELLQQRVRQTMNEGLGITEIRRVEVSVDQIISEHRRA